MAMLRRVVDLAFALSLSLGVGVVAIFQPFGAEPVFWNLPVVVGFIISILAAYALRTRRQALSSNTVWKYSGITFIIFAVLSYGFGIGIASDRESPLVVLAIWLVAAILSYSFYHYQKQTEASA